VLPVPLPFETLDEPGVPAAVVPMFALPVPSPPPVAVPAAVPFVPVLPEPEPNVSVPVPIELDVAPLSPVAAVLDADDPPAPSVELKLESEPPLLETPALLPAAPPLSAELDAAVDAVLSPEFSFDDAVEPLAFDDDPEFADDPPRFTSVPAAKAAATSTKIARTIANLGVRRRGGSWVGRSIGGAVEGRMSSRIAAMMAGSYPRSLGNRGRLPRPVVAGPACEETDVLDGKFEAMVDSPNILTLTHLNVDVRDLDRSAAFYADVLALPVKRRDGSLAVRWSGGLVVLVAGEPRISGSFHFGFRVAMRRDVDAWFTRFAEHTADIVEMPVERGDVYVGRLRDPDGYPIEVYAELPEG
jgi:catechol 2,3-dioxygenase-like lactoylglutathione lyase family enzyme